MDSLYAFKRKRFRNFRHTVTLRILYNGFPKHPALPVEATLNRDYLR
jgi:hypothetical protein